MTVEASGCLKYGGSLNTVTENLKSIYMLVSSSFPFTLNFPISVVGLEGNIIYFLFFASNYMKLGSVLLIITGFYSSSENFGSWYSRVLLNLTF